MRGVERPIDGGTEPDVAAIANHFDARTALREIPSTVVHDHDLEIPEGLISKRFQALPQTLIRSQGGYHNGHKGN